MQLLDCADHSLVSPHSEKAFLDMDFLRVLLFVMFVACAIVLPAYGN
jgi:hypothetical protein